MGIFFKSESDKYIVLVPQIVSEINTLLIELGDITSLLWTDVILFSIDNFQAKHTELISRLENLTNILTKIEDRKKYKIIVPWIDGSQSQLFFWEMAFKSSLTKIHTDLENRLNELKY